MTTAAILTAAGRGTRAGGECPKQWRLLAGRPVLAHALAAFAERADISRIILVIHPDDRALAASLLGPRTSVVVGGADRAASVRNALRALRGTDTTRVLIHDGARPLVSHAVISRVLGALETHPGVAPALAVTDALWRGGATVTGTLPRAGLFRAQTPQGFAFPAILDAHEAHSTTAAADDVEVARAAGLDVAIVAGDEDNLKLTWPDDFPRAERLLAARTAKGPPMDIRTGNGFDVHRFGPGDHLWLCGQRIAFPRGLQGHSDADVGMHALSDAIYGAQAMGDIGQHFPPSDPRWKGAASHIFLTHAISLARESGFALTHADVTLICEQPRIGPHAGAMRAELARLLSVDITRISVKATTTERLGFAGREEGIAALATATLVRP
ncbi:2-C-methyl-D-erythritol 4-phosphate cytidylyltransferase/2-C-methyl-D-erythritol 2,4-cyclodiphosphate synthase [Rhodobacteraceae bacterium MBR-64]